VNHLAVETESDSKVRRIVATRDKIKSFAGL
jgi:hypothetical protein